jgi:hypothetical protein
MYCFHGQISDAFGQVLGQLIGALGMELCIGGTPKWLVYIGNILWKWMI